ncbi:MAG: hypothetical protein FJY85_13335, partial [Deltaproteobacteria bacterium]|nr:hypothetical protein [Deltaproteobacteria bacterium]
ISFLQQELPDDSIVISGAQIESHNLGTIIITPSCIFVLRAVFPTTVVEFQEQSFMHERTTIERNMYRLLSNKVRQDHEALRNLLHQLLPGVTPSFQELIVISEDKEWATHDASIPSMPVIPIKNVCSYIRRFSGAAKLLSLSEMFKIAELLWVPQSFKSHDWANC